MNNDLISRSVLIEEIRERMLDEDEIMHELDREYNKGLMRAIKCVKRAPAVDAEPVRHTKWVWDNDAMDWNVGAWVCSDWRNRNKNIHDVWSGSQYCPNCGAKMDGKDGDNGV